MKILRIPIISQIQCYDIGESIATEVRVKSPSRLYTFLMKSRCENVTKFVINEV